MKLGARYLTALVAVTLVAAMLGMLFSAPVASAAETRQGETIVFSVGGQDQMKVRNHLAPVANDVWTSDVLGRTRDTVGQTDPDTDALMPYIIKGVDANNDSAFQRAEKGVFSKDPSPWNATPTDSKDIQWRRTVYAYYDFNGVYFHDGVQATIGDVLFGYALYALGPRFNTDLRVLWDQAGSAAGNFTQTRWQWIRYQWCDPTDAQWEGASTLPGDNTLRCALRFDLQDDFALFYEATLVAAEVLPRHIFEGTGGGRHADFGRAIYPELTSCSYAANCYGLGIPPTETLFTPFDWGAAEGWKMTDADVIGTGPFKFGTWAFGQFSRVDTYDRFFWGVDPNNPSVVLDPDVTAYFHKPFIDGILFKIYKTTQLGIFALQAGEIDFYHWNVPPEFVPDMLNDPNVRVWSNAEPGFFYLSYNMRLGTFGYSTFPPASRADDTGLPFRRAMAHLIDKSTIVRTLLQNYGVIADGPLSPANTFWYNGSLPKYPFDPATAAQILDNAGWTDTDGDGWRNLPGKGNAEIKILTPQADYDPIRASAGAMIAAAARGVGIHIKSEPTAFGTIVDVIRSRVGFDMFILGWRIGGTDPDYMFSFYHSSNSVPGGQNDASFYDAEYDAVVEASRKALDRTVRQQLIRDAQGIISTQLPNDVLYYRTNIEAQRQDRFTNFTVASGSIWGYWSLLSIRRPSANFLRASFTAPSAVQEGSTGNAVTVTVRDQDGAIVSGAAASLTISTPNGGTWSNGLASISGTSNVNGQFTATYNAPTSLTGQLDVVVDAVVSKTPEFPDPAGKSTIVTVFPVGVPFLSVTVDLASGDLVQTGDPLVFGVSVRDQDQASAPTATVAITVDPSGPTISPNNQPAAQMGTVTFTAPASIATQTQAFTVAVTSTLAGFQAGTASFDMTVVQKTVGGPPCPGGLPRNADGTCPTPVTPGLDVLPILAVIGAAALLVGVVQARRKKGN